MTVNNLKILNRLIWTEHPHEYIHYEKIVFINIKNSIYAKENLFHDSSRYHNNGKHFF